jgi:hypothetical protein
LGAAKWTELFYRSEVMKIPVRVYVTLLEFNHEVDFKQLKQEVSLHEKTQASLED